MDYLQVLTSPLANDLLLNVRGQYVRKLVDLKKMDAIGSTFIRKNYFYSRK